MYHMQTLAAQLAKVSAFYDAFEKQLLQQLDTYGSGASTPAADQLARLHQQVQDLTKFAALNYVAVLKAIKKRNRRLRDSCGDQVVTVAPFSVLKHQAFFTSRRLPLITQQAKALHEVRTSCYSLRHHMVTAYDWGPTHRIPLLRYLTSRNWNARSRSGMLCVFPASYKSLRNARVTPWP